MHTSQGGASLNVNRLGPYPIVRHFLERLNLGGIIRSCVGTGRDRTLGHDEALAVLVQNVLDSPAPLYRIAEWAAPIAPSALGLTPEQKRVLNDDRIARMLDALVSERGKSIWFRLALRMIKQFKLDTSRMHQDTTSVTFSGAYRSSHAEPVITLGYNKDHRSDLKQLVFGLTVTADGAVPINHQIWSGNRTDDTVHRDNLEELRQLLGKTDFIYVADTKLATDANLQEISDHGGKFVTVWSRNRKEDKEFRGQLRRQRIRWRKILEIPNHREFGGPPDVYSSCREGPERTAQSYRLVWVRSSGKAKRDQEAREQKLERARVELALLGKRLNRRRLKTHPQIRKAVRQILQHYGVEEFLSVKVQAHRQEEIRHLKRGRPSPGAAVRMVRKNIWQLKLQWETARLREEKRTDGVFPLVTNLEKPAKKEIVSIYKYQPYIEKRFSQLKTNLEVAPVYLKKPLRCAGLVHAYYVALAVSSLIERAVRQGMAREKIESLPLFPEGRPTSTPTCQRILEAFKGLSWYEFKRGDDLVHFPIKLTELQQLLLKLLDVPRERYS